MIRMPMLSVFLSFIVAAACVADDGPEIPVTFEELWAGFDPRADPLDTLVVREWEKDSVVYRYVTFHVGTFKHVPARIAAYYAFPRGATHAAALMHIHGGGQRAFLHEVEFYAKRGYPCLSINWGDQEMEDARAGEPNTDWGAIDPTQRNGIHYFSLRPGDKQLEPVDSPRNNNWYVLTLAARRGLTFLEQQPEVDPERLGVYGHSMGGSITMYVAGSDPRIKACAPSVGGSGFRTQPWPLLPQMTLETPQEMAASATVATDRVDPWIDNFSSPWRDWFRLSPDNPHHWDFSTRKVADPKWRGQDGQRLTLELAIDEPNELVIVMTENVFRSYRGSEKEFVAVVPLEGGDQPQTIQLEPHDFQTIDGELLASWRNIDLLSLRAYYEKGSKRLGSTAWSGPQPRLKRLRWASP